MIHRSSIIVYTPLTKKAIVFSENYSEYSSKVKKSLSGRECLAAIERVDMNVVREMAAWNTLLIRTRK